MSRVRLAGGSGAFASGTVAAVKVGGVVTVAYNPAVKVGVDIPANASTVIATLPEGFRPNAMVVSFLFRPISTGAQFSGYIAVSPNGKVTVNSASAIPAGGNVYFGSLTYGPAS